ncbi:GlxA family transcriptional regulator [Thalassomonas haliotis]|uniref:Helix-turn-helix domain-containing protein n=1 Tax=Thalassomonas haliotis TaxID=485448 RepID=A0ABY7VJ80_9GAMM|nr:helix-turn-helix domain-containing protein [Thalassomonas haliotis]WDE13521.1 helix-turn-helix domain-containing protein [Thalassomonas haliotis]
MKNILIYTPKHAVAMSITLVKELCWVACAYAREKAVDKKSRAEKTAGGLAAAKAGAEPFNPGDYVNLVSEDGLPVSSFSGNSISMDLSVAQITDIDALFIGAFWGSPREMLAQSPRLLALLPRLAQKKVPVAAVSNGAFLLAQAGLLNDKIATIYPPNAAAFRQAYPGVKLHPQKAITDAGNLYCANGIASGCDLTVAIIEKLYGSVVARRISRDFLLGFNRDYTSVNVGFDGQKYHKDHQVLTAQSWLEQHFCDEVNMQILAGDMGMSPRNFSRRFKRATGDSPGQYLKRLRIEAGKELLRDSDLSVAEIVYRVGYSDVSYFCRTFKAMQGCMPNCYRRQHNEQFVLAQVR